MNGSTSLLFAAAPVIMMRDMERIIILLEDKWNTESLPGAAAAANTYRKYGFDTDVCIVKEQDLTAPGVHEDVFGTLYIADSARLLRQLIGSGAAFCAYSHSGNGNEDLGAADYILMELQWVDRDSLIKIWQRQRNIPWTILETERFVVREFVPEDLGAIYELYDEDARRFLEPPSVNRSLEKEILSAYIRRVYRLCGYGHWAVIAKKSGELIGRMGFAFPPSADPGFPSVPDAMFGYLVRRDRRRQGIVIEVGAAILQYGFDKLGFETIGADTAVSNTVSDKILRTFSFIPVAEVQNQRYYILHKKNWDQCPARDAQECSK